MCKGPGVGTSMGVESRGSGTHLGRAHAQMGQEKGRAEHEGHVASEGVFEQKQRTPGEGLTAGWAYDQPGFL